MDIITVRIRDQTGEEMCLKVKTGTRMRNIFDAYARRKGIQPSALRFVWGGERMNADATVAQYELEDKDLIDCLLESQGC